MGRHPRPVDPAFCEFVAARSAALFRTAVLITGDRHLAEDLVQGALERAFKHWGRVKAADAPEAYVRRIMANLANDRKHRRQLAAEHLTLDGDDHEPPPAAGDAFADVDARHAVVKALRGLPVGQRTVLVLRYFDDMSEAQIAGALGVSNGTVKSQAARGLAKLRAALADAPEDDGRSAASAASARVLRFPEGEVA